MTRARRELVSLESTAYYHCICRCVRRAFLCGNDAWSGRSYEHRRDWVVERMNVLQTVFAIEVCAYAIMSNHYHLVVRLNPGLAADWTAEEVAERWDRLFSIPTLVERYLRGDSITAAEQQNALEIIEEWRARLSDLSWYMRCLNEDLARRANAEDGCKGRFWEGRFKSQALLDEAAVLTCMSYVDLNPIRAGMAETPDNSDFTSIQRRIQTLQAKPGSEAPELMELTTEHRSNAHPNHFSFSLTDYLQLVDWAGRAVREDKRGAIPAGVPPILERLGIDPARYLRHVSRGGRAYHASALGGLASLRLAAEALGRKYLKGVMAAAKLYPSAVRG